MRIGRNFAVRLCIECRGNDCQLPLSFIWGRAIPYHKQVGNVVFLKQSSYYYSMEWNQTKVPASDLWPIQIYDSSLKITAMYYCFLPYRCWCWFLFHFSTCKSHFIHPVSYNLILNIDFCLHTFVYHLFSCAISIFMAFMLNFLSRHFDVFLAVPMFPFYNLLIMYTCNKL